MSARDILAVVSDTHTNNSTGLLQPTVVRDDGQPVHFSKAQQWMWGHWCDLIQRIDGMRKAKDRITVVVNGDCIDRNPRTTALISYNNADIVRFGVATLNPLRQLANSGFFIVRGTEIHAGIAGELEESVARELKATPYPEDSQRFSCWELRLDLQGVLFDFAHHGSTGRLDWTLLNASGRVAVETASGCEEDGERAPDFVIRGHVHRFTDTGLTYPTRVITCPSWQLTTSFGHRIAPGKELKIGALIFVIENGKASFEAILHKPVKDKRWQPK